MIATEMQEGQVYKTCESELEYFARKTGNVPEGVQVEVFMPKSGKWKQTVVPNEYKVRDLNDTEKEIYAKISEPKVRKPRAPKDPNAPVKAVQPKAKGLVSGLGMIAAWAKNINEFATVEGGRSKVIEAMLADFPQKAESINKWVDAYLTYYNTGRFGHCGFPRLEKHVYWILSEAEKAAGVTNRNHRGPRKPKVEVAAEVPAAPAA